MTPGTWQVMAPSRKIYAIKRIRLEGRDTETAMGFIDEIRLLTRLRNQPNIIQLVDAEVTQWRDAVVLMLAGAGIQHMLCRSSQPDS